MIETFDWDALKSFLAIARSGRLTSAARELGIDHSTLNRRINGLEEALGAKLFERGPSGYRLTGQGRRLMTSAEAMEQAAISVLRDVADATQAISGSIRIGTPDGFGTMFLAPRIGKLIERHPGLEVQLATRPRLFSLSQREADIAIGLARPAKGRLKARKLTDYELGLYASRDYLARHGEITERASLEGRRLIGYIDEMIYAPQLDYFPLVTSETKPHIASSNLLAQHQATLAGYGLCVLPVFMAADDDRLVRVLPRQIALHRTFWIIVHEDLAELARVRVTVDFMVEAVRSAKRLFLP